MSLRILSLGEPDPHDVESAAKLYLEYDRQGRLTDDVASSFAMSVYDFDAVYKRAHELKRAQQNQTAAGA